MNQRLEDVTCHRCGLLCDDLVLEWQDGKPVMNHACEKGRETLEQLLQIDQQAYSVEDLDENIARANDWLKEATNPLLTGFYGLSIEDLQTGLHWAESRQMIVSTGSSSEKTLAMQRYGGSSCSFGEIRHRCDLLISFGVDLFRHWPRFNERFLEPKGRFLPKDNARRLIYIGPESELEDSSRYDETILIEPEETIDLLADLRSLLNGKEFHSLHAPALDLLTNVFGEQVDKAAYPVLLQGNTGEGVATELTQLTRDCQQRSRLHTVSTGSHFPGKPQETILARTGFPDHLAFRGKDIIYDPFRYHARELMNRREVDLIVHLGPLTEANRKQFQNWLQADSSARLITITDQNEQWTRNEERIVPFHVKQVGLSARGTLLRSDGIPIPARILAESPRPSLIDILRRLQ